MQKRYKILFVISSLRAGGAERVLVTLCNYLCNKFDITILTFDDELSFYPLDGRIFVDRLNFGVDDFGFFGNLKKRYLKIKALRKIFKTDNYNAVISFIDNSNILCSLAKIGLNTKLIISEHSNHLLLKSKFWQILRRLSYPFANALVVLSKFDYDFYTFVKNKKIIYNPLSIDIKKDQNKENIILGIGRLEEVKNFELFINSIALIKDKINNYEIIIAGEGSQKEKLINLAKELGVNIKFIGSVKDVCSLYDRAKIVVISSNAEGFPNVLIEAMARGCLVISTNCLTGPSEMIENNKNGILVPVGDKFALSEGILKLASGTYEEFIDLSYKRVENLRISNIANSWISLIKEIV